MEQLLTDEQIVAKAIEKEKSNGFGSLAKSTRRVKSAYGIGFLDGAEYARRQIMEKLSGMKVYMLYDYPDSIQQFFGVFFSKKDAQDAIFDNSLWEGDNKDYTCAGYAIEEMTLNPESICEKE